MKKFQYAIVTADNRFKGALDELNRMGQEGWELVAANHIGRKYKTEYHLKREFGLSTTDKMTTKTVDRHILGGVAEVDLLLRSVGKPMGLKTVALRLEQIGYSIKETEVVMDIVRNNHLWGEGYRFTLAGEAVDIVRE